MKTRSQFPFFFFFCGNFRSMCPKVIALQLEYVFHFLFFIDLLWNTMLPLIQLLAIDEFLVISPNQALFAFCKKLEMTDFSIWKDNNKKFCGFPTILIGPSLKQQLKCISDFCFYEYKMLGNIVIPPSVTSIGTSEFRRCTGWNLLRHTIKSMQHS